MNRNQAKYFIPHSMQTYLILDSKLRDLSPYVPSTYLEYR